MAPKIVLTGASGKIGGEVLRAILDYKLASPTDLVIATRSSESPLIQRAAAQGAIIRPSDYDSTGVMIKAFAGCERLFLISSSQIDLDFDDAARGGREQQHFKLLEAAKQAGVSHVYYASLAFGSSSTAGVMRAHLKTEDFLREQKSFDFTVMREGIYHDSWPLYLGYYNTPSDNRTCIVIGPDGPISWTSLEDIGLSSALVLTDDRHAWTGKTFWLSARRTFTVTEIAEKVGSIRGRALKAEVRSQEEYIKHYTLEQSTDSAKVVWWASTYPALEAGECDINDPTLEKLLASRGRTPQSIEDIITRMVRG